MENKVREDDLDSTMGHLRKEEPPSWAGVPQLSIMAQAIGYNFPYYEYAQSEM